MTTLPNLSGGESSFVDIPRGAVFEFLRGLIDYAGLFPPAALELDPAIRNYGRDRRSADSWMLSTFICPAERLGDLGGYVPELFSEVGSGESGEAVCLRVSALAPRVAKESSFAEAWAETRGAIERFESAHGSCVSVDAVEVAVPEDLFGSAASLASWIRSVDFGERGGRNAEVDSAAGVVPRDRTLFFEPPLRESWKSDITCLVEALAVSAVSAASAASAEGTTPGLRYGFKFRCGGVVASAFPTVSQLAHVIATTAQHKVAFKATAGLHHPLRHYHDSVQTKMHGFLNVFGASLLARTRGLAEDEIAELLADENPHHFVLSEDCFCWKDHAATAREIATLRKDIVSFGSCSFDEPREDLRELRIL